jgi:hypothetical protein
MPYRDGAPKLWFQGITANVSETRFWVRRFGSPPLNSAWPPYSPPRCFLLHPHAPGGTRRGPSFAPLTSRLLYACCAPWLTSPPPAKEM